MHNLIDVTTSIKNMILGDGGNVTAYGSGDLIKNLTPVAPGEKLHFYQSQPVDSSFCFRWNYYDLDGNYVTRGSSPADSDFELTIPSDIYYLWISYPNRGDVSVTRVTAYDTINAQITAQINGGTNQ